jgi:hypothetical protein
MVTTQAASFSAWSAYESVLLDPATAAFFAARLSSEQSDGESNPPSKKKKKKKRKLRDDGSGSDEDADYGPIAVVCEHCGGAVPEVSLRVASLDGTTLDVRVAQRGLVVEVKWLVGQVRGRGLFGMVSASTHNVLLSFADARHGPGPDRALRRRKGGRPA